MSNAPPPVRKTRKLIIVGDRAFAEIAFEYFEAASPYRVAAFAVEAKFIAKPSLFDLPIEPFETLESRYPPGEFDVFVAVVYTQLNRLRTRLAAAAKAKGYRLASFVSPHAFVWRNVRIGEHCFIFENNVVQPFTTIGDNVILWSGNHIGHHSAIEDNVFVSSHVVVSGFCRIGRNSFLGVNASIGNNVSVGEDCWLGPGVSVTKDVPAGQLLHRPDSEASKVSAPRFFKVERV